MARESPPGNGPANFLPFLSVEGEVWKNEPSLGASPTSRTLYEHAIACTCRFTKSDRTTADVLDPGLDVDLTDDLASRASSVFAPKKRTPAGYSQAS
jgi:hypothetical protein